VIPGYRSNEFADGFKAYQKGFGKDACFYTKADPVKREEWILGWEYARDNEDRIPKVVC
jgi:ribosome modulation factor